MKLTDKPSWITIQYICVLFLTTCLLGIYIPYLAVVWFIAILFCWLTIPAVIIDGISFFYSLRCNTNHKKILLTLHVMNILLFSFWFFKSDERCDAFIMAQYCRGENAFWMRSTAARYKSMLLDSTVLYVEIKNGTVPQYDILSEQDMKELKRLLEDCCGCIGIDVNNYSNSGYSRLLFRRIGMGMYSFRFYDHPLSLEQQDSLNSKENLIVYNDSTVFEYGSGAFGSLDFPGKEDFLEKSKSHTEIIKAKGRDWYVNVQPGGFLGNNECISISTNQSALDDSSGCKFYTDEIYYAADSAGRLNIYAPYSSIKKPTKNDAGILIHELRNYDTTSKYRKDYSAMGLKRITTVRPNH